MKSKLIRIIPYISNFKENNKEISFTGIFKGVCKSQFPVYSELTPNIELIISKYFSEPLYFFNRGINPENYLNKKDNLNNAYVDINLVKNFYINNIENKNDNSKILVDNFYNSNFEKSLSIIGTKNERKKINLIEKIISYILYILQTILFKKSSKGLLLGLKFTEFGIKNNEIFNILGKIIINKKTKEMKISNPKLFIKDKLEYKFILIKKLKKLNNLKKLLLLIFVFSIYLLFKRVLKIKNTIKEYLIKRKNLFNLDQLKGIKQWFIKDFNCISCQSNMKNIIFKPCYDFVICLDCYKKHSIERCLWCNKEIKEIVKIFAI